MTDLAGASSDNLEAAERRLRAAVVERPDDVTAQAMLGAALRAKGDAAGAFEVLEPLAASHSGSAAVQVELGMAQLKLGMGRAAIASLSSAVKLDPKLSFAWRALHQQLMLSGQSRLANEVRIRALQALTPKSDLSPAVDAFVEGRLDAAETLLRSHLTARTHDAMGLFLLAEVGVRLERLAQAEDLLARCLKIAPTFAAARASHAQVLIGMDRGAEALAEAQVLLEGAPENIGYRCLESAALELVGEYEAALDRSERLLAEFSDHPRAWVRHGRLLKTLGRDDEAIAAYRKALDLEPGLGEAYVALSDLKTYRFSAFDAEIMRGRLSDEALSRSERRRLHYALGKALEDVEDYAGAIEHYVAGGKLRPRVDEPIDISDLVTHSKATFTAPFIAEREGGGVIAPDPIFVVGLPRSGSTLIEQILASHSKVEGTRELSHLWTVVGETIGDFRGGERPGLQERLASLDGPGLARLGGDYLKAARAHRHTQRPFFVDKMPGNFLLVGVIHLILPNAKIIDARRHPLGCGLACLRQNFQSGLAFTADQAEFGRYYRRYLELMAHFDEVLPGRMHRVIYERLVGDLEGEVRRLLDYCGLEFEDACLRFHENARPVRTPSAGQVRQPLYADSVEHWRRFDPWLGPMKAALGDALDAYPDVPRRF